MIESQSREAIFSRPAQARVGLPLCLVAGDLDAYFQGKEGGCTVVAHGFGRCLSEFACQMEMHHDIG